LLRAQVPASRIYTAQDIFENPQYRVRGMIQRMATRDGYDLDVPGIVPKLSGTPGAIRSPAPRLGENTAEVLDSCGVSLERQKSLAARKAI
jgi:formyl-CoA transferase